MPPIPEMIQLLDKIKLIHEKKNADYTASGRPFENFERASLLISWFNEDRDKAFVNHIATKLARLATLLNNNKIPNHESIDDSFLDLCTYCLLWSSSRMKPLNKGHYTQGYKEEVTNVKSISQSSHINPSNEKALHDLLLLDIPLLYSSLDKKATLTSGRTVTIPPYFPIGSYFEVKK